MLQAAFNIFFDDFWVYKPFCTLFFSLGYYSQLFWVFTPFVHFFCGFVAEAFYISIYSTWRVNIDGYFFFVILWPKPFTLVYSICASTKIPFEPVQKLFLSTGFLGRYQVTSAWVLRKVIYIYIVGAFPYRLFASL